jgi:hypothetical protein
MKHWIQSIVNSGLHLFECRICGRRWLPEQSPDDSLCEGAN